MDVLFQNPLETVQLIPIFSYLNLLSNFLYAEEYLLEIDRNKQIPIVNALYKYLQDYENVKHKKVKLIENLLKESNMYGGKEDEYIDITFVNAMFDYIITSLVFEKYGNIYGFLADIFLKAENSQIDEILNLIMLSLKSASFENEYGPNSKLSPLAVERLYNDVILPLFPQSKAGLNLMSLDYIYAQTGLMFLRAGKLNAIYYSNNDTDVLDQNETNLFDQYLATGHVIERLIQIDPDSFEMLKAFALPALSYYITHSKYLFTFENMPRVILEATFWKTAFNLLFEYTRNSFNDIEMKLNKDSTRILHVSLSNFQSLTALANDVLKNYCPGTEVSEDRLHSFLKSPEEFRCMDDEELPDPNIYFISQINTITELYENYYFPLIRDVFPKYLIDKFEDEDVTIKLLFWDNAKNHDDLLEIYFSDTGIYNFFILKFENYNLMLVNATDKIDIFNVNRMNFRVFKTNNEDMNVFFSKLVKYKKFRLESLLNSLENCQGVYKGMKNNWWKEFGLSLVPYFPCLIATCGTNNASNCEADNIKVFQKYPIDISTKIIHTNTNTFLSLFNTDMKSVLLRRESIQAVDDFVTKKYISPETYALLVDKLFLNITLHLNDPGFQFTFVTMNVISGLEKIINCLENRTLFSFQSVIGSLSNISLLKSSTYRSVGTIGEENRLVFVKTLNNHNETGYGYKFIFTTSNSSEIAELKIGYKSKEEKLISRVRDSEERNVFITFNNKTLQPEIENRLYEINNQLVSSPTKLSFSGIPLLQSDSCDEKCSDNKYLEYSKNASLCQRQLRLMVKSAFEESSLKLIKNLENLFEELVHNVITKYHFSNNETLTEFVNYWLNSTFFNESIWNENYAIENSDLLNKLRYDLRFENHNISNYEGKLRINTFYSKVERQMIEGNESIESIIKNYNEQKASCFVTFHDYYAIRNYVTTGYRRITADTTEAKLMKLALYKLAVRQSDDPEEEFELKLFKFESTPKKIFDMLSKKEYITLQRFTQASPSAEYAITYAGKPAPDCVNIVYEMIFDGPYVRAKVEHFYELQRMSVILLPGSEFLIEDRSVVELAGLGNFFKLKLRFQHNFNYKYEWYRSIMTKFSLDF